MLKYTEIADMIGKSGYKKKYVAERMGMTQQQLCDVLGGRRKLLADEYVKFCELFKIHADGRPME